LEKDGRGEGGKKRKAELKRESAGPGRGHLESKKVRRLRAFGYDWEEREALAAKKK